MTLEEYLKENNITQSEFGKSIDRNQVYVHRLIKGGVPVTIDDAEAIKIATNGLVCANDFYHKDKIV